jgi:hypothetical protein
MKPESLKIDEIEYVRKDSLKSQPVIAPAPKGVFPLQVGMAVFIRTVTHHHTGRILDIGPDWIQLDEAAWIASDGRFHQALATGVFDEVEPIPGWCLVGRGAIIDAYPWPHPLPRAAK